MRSNGCNVGPSSRCYRSDVLQLNAIGKRLIVERGPTMIQVSRENEITPLFMLEVDLAKGRLRNCPLLDSSRHLLEGLPFLELRSGIPKNRLFQ